jgi:hypothetical protein
MARIPSSEVTFHPHSYGDPAGRLFLWNGQLYRGIRSASAPFFGKLLQSGVIQHLVDRGLLIDTEPTPLTLDGFDLVVRHRSIPFASYPEEWCAAMLRDAALTMLDLLAELATYGLSLKDGHPWNLLFDAGRFVYVDLSSIIPAQVEHRWPGYDGFCRFSLYPLLLMSHGQERIARRLLPEREGVLKSDLLGLTRSPGLLAWSRSVMGRLASGLRSRVSAPGRSSLATESAPMRSVLRKQAGRSQSQMRPLKQLRREIEHLAFPESRPTYADHDSDSIRTFAPEDAWTAKQHGVYRILTDLRPGSVLDICTGTGWCSKLAALLNIRVVSFDADPARVTQLYCETRDNKWSILPLLMDFTDPTPARGLFGHWAIAATDRFQCDMVLALDLVHRTVFHRHLDFDHIVGGLALFTKRWLVVEFVPREDGEVCKLWSDSWLWYTLDNFIKALGRRFRDVKLLPSHPEPRVLVVCEK